LLIAKNQPIASENQCTNKPTVLYSKKQSAQKIDEANRNPMPFLPKLACSTDVVYGPATSQQDGEQYY